MWRRRVGHGAIFCAFSLGLITGGITSAAVLSVASGIVSPLPAAAASGLITACVLAALLREFKLLRFRLPENQRLVPQEIFANHPLLAFSQFGFEMGTGIRTYVPATAPYLLAAMIVLLGPPLPLAVLAGVGFGLGRAAMPASRSLRGSGAEWDGRLRRQIGIIQKTAILALAVAAAVLVVNE